MPEPLLKLYMDMRGWDALALAELLHVPANMVQQWLDGEDIPRSYGILITLLGEELLDIGALDLAHDVIDAYVADPV